MLSLYQLKPRFQGLLRPLAARMATAGVTANQVTIFTGAASVAVGIAIAVTGRGWMALPFVLFARMAMNAVDGMLAREFGQKSRLGAVLNELGDVIADAALTLPFALLPGWYPLAAGAAIFASALTEFAGLMGLVAGGARRNDGPFGKSDRAFALGAIGVWVALDWPVSPVVPYVWILLCCVTVVRRAYGALG